VQINFNIFKEIGVQLDKKYWYEHVPKSVIANQGGKMTILRNQQVQTDRTISNNKPHIITRDNENGICQLIDVAISGDRNVIKKETKILKYKDLEIQHMWNVKARVIPVIIGATGTISKSFRKYVSDIPGNHDIKGLQKTAILSTHSLFIFSSDTNMFVSSANNTTFDPIIFRGGSFMYNENIIGPRIEPCGTPCSISPVVETVLVSCYLYPHIVSSVIGKIQTISLKHL